MGNTPGFVETKRYRNMHETTQMSNSLHSCILTLQLVTMVSPLTAAQYLSKAQVWLGAAPDEWTVATPRQSSRPLSRFSCPRSCFQEGLAQ